MSVEVQWVVGPGGGDKAIIDIICVVYLNTPHPWDNTINAFIIYSMFDPTKR